MSKHIQNLHRLCNKMESRYGKDDDLVVDLRKTISVHEAKKAKNSAAILQRRRMAISSPEAPHLGSLSR